MEGSDGRKLESFTISRPEMVEERIGIRNNGGMEKRLHSG